MAKMHLHEDEINFLNVIKNPIRWFGIIYPYFLVIIIIGGVYYYRSMSRTYRNNVSPMALDSSNIFVDIKPTKGGVSEGVDVKTISNPTKELIQKGENIFKANCVTCHGEQGMGDGPAGQVMSPKPRNFHQSTGWVNGRNFAAMFTTVTEGIANSGMPSFSQLSAADRVAVVSYVRTFANDFPPVTNQDITTLETKFDISQGGTTAAKIPIDSSMKVTTADALPKAREIFSIISQINSNPEVSGAQILNRVSKDKIRIVSFLRSSNNWNTSLDDFIKTIISSINTNGFSPEVMNLNREEWNQLFTYLNRLFSNKNA